MDIDLAAKEYFSRDEWLHEVLSFVILLCNRESLDRGNTTIYRNEKGTYSTNFGEGEMMFDGANNLYSAFEWFHSHIERYAEKFTDTHRRNNVNMGFGHILTSGSSRLRIQALFELPKVCVTMRNAPFSLFLSPGEFYKLLFKAVDLYKPDLFILDLNQDVKNHKNAASRFEIALALRQ